MKKLWLASVLALSFGALTTAQAQQIHPRYKGDVMVIGKDMKPQGKTMKHEKMACCNVTETPMTHRKDKDPKAIAINKTAALDRKVQLTHQQEKKVQRLYKKEAKQMVKMQELKKENAAAIKDILTKEQLQKVHPKRTVAMYSTGGHIRPAIMKQDRPGRMIHMKAKTTDLKTKAQLK